MITGLNKVIVCSKSNYLTRFADILLNIPAMREIYIEFDLRFDLEPTYLDDKEACSPVGLQMRVFAPYQYQGVTPGVFYQLKPDEEAILQPGMQVKLGQLTFLCERFNTGIISYRGYRFRMEDAYAI